jgi:hypothetical protein
MSIGGWMGGFCLGLYEEMTTEKLLKKEQLISWARSVKVARNILVTRNRSSRVGVGLITEPMWEINAVVYTSKNEQCGTKSWKAKAVCEDLETAFEKKVSFEMKLP